MDTVVSKSVEVRPASPARPPVLRNGTTITGSIVAFAHGVMLGYFFGWAWCAAWCVVSIAVLIWLVKDTVAARGGDAKAEARSYVTQFALITLWMASAIALFLTGTSAGLILGVTIPASWAIHVIFAGKANMKLVGRALAVCALPLVAFMLYVAWTDLPAWAAIAGTIAALAMLAGIGEAAKLSGRTYSELQKALAESSSTKERLEFAIQSAGDGYFEVDLDTMICTLNPGLSKKFMLGFVPQDVSIAKDFIHHDDVGMLFGSLMAVKEHRSDGWKQQLRVRLPDGGWCWMQLRAQRLAANALHGPKLIGTVVDVTASKLIEEELRAAKENAEASSNAKSQFLANMSHEIRTPLNGVLGMAQALEGDDLTPAQKEKVGVILDSGKSLMALLNDVLDLTKIEAGKLEISAVPGDFLHTMKRTRQLFQSTAEEKGLDLLVRYDANFPQRLTYDPTRVRQCVSNLLSNAIKFTAQGSVEVAIKAKPLEHGAYMIVVDVSDTGIGMSEDTCAKLFTVFTQADGATTRKFGGSGLGLAISRQLARMMGGDLVVKSEEGAGSTFRLTFKAQEAAAAAAPAPAAQNATKVEPVKRSLRGLRVLLTDDNAINRQVIKLFLQPQGCDIAEATNGKEALDKIATGDFDVVLMDIHMPVMDGKEAVKRIRATDKWQTLPVIALTADAMSGDREKYLALGMT
ncbi:MAG TPA: ATP-binding protein, partial [Hyphomonadaceae bacterium]|nr:ATP-binding protein [Hyphomonadaceae bacterium]